MIEETVREDRRVTIPGIVGTESAATPELDPERRAGAFLRAARIIHPFPTLLNVAATVGLALVAVRGLPEVPRLVAMAAVMLCAQSAIGVANDYYDRDLDANAKSWKPIPAGLVRPRTAAVLALVLIVATASAATTLGAASFALAMLGLACGLAYDARLKRTLLSALPFMVAIPTLPLWVWLTLDAWQPVCWWLLPLGALLGVALHLANTLPDIESDAAHGVMGLTHRIGARWAMGLAWAAFATALALSVALAPFVHYDLRVYAPALLTGVAALAASAAAVAILRDEFALRLGFGVLSLASAVLAVGWLAAVT
jgi:4-hydroxybenzoate polyprenyltransferase